MMRNFGGLAFNSELLFIESGSFLYRLEWVPPLLSGLTGKKGEKRTLGKIFYGFTPQQQGWKLEIPWVFHKGVCVQCVYILKELVVFFPQLSQGILPPLDY